MDLEDIEAFVEVAQTGGFGRAGRRLSQSKSMVSRRVARLETQLGAQLLSRTTRGVALTEAGRDFKDRGERMLAEMEAARDALAGGGGELVGALRISAPLSFGMTHLAPVLAELAERHPRLSIDAAYSDRKVDLIGERFDAAVRMGHLEDSSLIARRIAPIRAIVVANPGYLARRGTPMAPQDLADHEILLQQGAEAWPFQDGKRLVTVRSESRFKADSAHALAAAAAAGLGIAMIPSFLASGFIERGELVPLMFDYPVPEAGLYVVRPPPAGPATGKVRALTDLLVERFGGEPFWDACYAAKKQFEAALTGGPAPVRSDQP